MPDEAGNVAVLGPDGAFIGGSGALIGGDTLGCFLQREGLARATVVARCTAS
jgi:hypothetical protein